MEKQYTPEHFLPSNNEVLVFGANRLYVHGKGAALFARQHCGAVNGKGGLQGKSYAIVTKELRRGFSSVTLDEIAKEISVFIDFAAEHSELKFYVTKIGTNLAGFTMNEIGDIFRALAPKISPNIVLPREFV